MERFSAPGFIWQSWSLSEIPSTLLMLIRYLVGTLLVSVFAAGSLPLPPAYEHSSIGEWLSPTAQAKSKVRSLIDRVLGKTMPEGIVKKNGRIEATPVDVAAKYPGRLVDVTVEKGGPVTHLENSPTRSL